MREQVVSFPPQPVITSDNLVVSIDTVLYFKVVDPVRATYEISNFLQAIEQLTVTTLRNVIGSLDLERALTSREEINRHLSSVLDETTGRWGIKVTRVEIKAIEPPPSIRDSMEKQMRAERERRATILNAEGHKQAAILTAEGEKQSPVLRADGDRQARILQAEGQAKAIRTVFDAIHQANPSQKVLAYQYLQALPQIANGTANKVWIVPTELSRALDGIGGALGGLANMVGDMPTSDGRRGQRSSARRPRRPRPRRPRRQQGRRGRSARPRRRSVGDPDRDGGAARAGADPAVGGARRRRLQRRAPSRTAPDPRHRGNAAGPRSDRGRPLPSMISVGISLRAGSGYLPCCWHRIPTVAPGPLGLSPPRRSHEHQPSPHGERPARCGSLRPGSGRAPGRRLRTHDHLLPVREAVWIWSVRRYARLALWALPAAAAAATGWTTLGVDTPPGPLVVELAADWLSHDRDDRAGRPAGRRRVRAAPALAGLLLGAGRLVCSPCRWRRCRPASPRPAAPLTADQLHLVALVAAALQRRGLAAAGLGGLPLQAGQPGRRHPADAGRASIGAGTYARQPLPTVGALLLLAAGTGLAWTGGRLIPRA